MEVLEPFRDRSGLGFASYPAQLQHAMPHPEGELHIREGIAVTDRTYGGEGQKSIFPFWC